MCIKTTGILQALDGMAFGFCKRRYNKLLHVVRDNLVTILGRRNYKFSSPRTQGGKKKICQLKHGYRLKYLKP